MSPDPKRIQVVLGQKARGFRLAKGLSQERLAELAELDRTYISSFERGRRNISIQNVARIATALGIAMEDFFRGL